MLLFILTPCSLLLSFSHTPIFLPFFWLLLLSFAFMSFSPYFSCYTLLLVMPHNLLLLYMSLLSLSFLAWLAVTVEGGGGCRGLRYSCFPCLACICVHLFVLVNLFLCALRFLSLSWHIMFTILNMYIVLFLSLLIPIQLCSHPDMCNYYSQFPSIFFLSELWATDPPGGGELHSLHQPAR